MITHRGKPSVVVLSSTFLLLLCSFAVAQSTSSDAPATKSDPYQMNIPREAPKPQPVVLPDRKLTEEGKTLVIRGMMAELGYARQPFPFGKEGLVLKGGKVVSPNEQQMAEIMASYGAAVKVGDRAQITQVRFKEKAILFDINGGPVKHKKWYERITVSGNGGAISPGQPGEDTNIHGSTLELAFDKFVPDLTSAQIKQLLDPVLNFNAKSATEAYLDTIPPKARVAIAEHRALVGMNREMVTYALGRPPQKYRDKDGDVDYEEWIYGTPPQDVQYVRFVGDEVVRVETMKVDGTKMVRTEREITLEPQQPQVAQQQPGEPGQPGAQGQAQPTAAGPSVATTRPSLRRPGEDTGAQPDPTSAPKNPGAGVPDMTTPGGQPDPSQPAPKPVPGSTPNLAGAS